MVAPLRLRSKGGRQHRLHPLPEMLVAALEWLLVACESRLFLRFWAEARARAEVAARAEGAEGAEEEGEEEGGGEEEGEPAGRPRRARR